MNVAQSADPLLSKATAELREMWQVKLLAETKGTTRAVVQAIIAHEWPAMLPLLLRIIDPNFKDIERPFIYSYATINKSGMVCAEMIGRDGRKKIVGLYTSDILMRDDFRRIADRLKFSDAERIAMFAVLKKWVVADLRIDHNGESIH